MASGWYYSRDGASFGPFSSAELVALAQSGRLRPTDMVWKDTLARWTPASQIKGLFPSTPTPDQTNNYQVPSGAKELSTATVVVADPRRIKPNTSVRIILEASDIVFVESSWFGTPKVLLRYPKLAVFQACWKEMDADVGDQVLHQWCNSITYGWKTGAVISAIQGPVTSRVLAVGIEDRSLPHDIQLLVFSEGTFSKVSLSDTLDELDNLVALRRKKSREADAAQQAAASQFTSGLEEMRQRVQEQNDSLRQKIAENEANKAAIRARLEELAAKREAILRQRAEQGEQPPSSNDMLSKIEQLAQMVEKGYLTKEEFEKKKAELLARL